MAKFLILALALGLAGCGTYAADVNTPIAGAGARLRIGQPVQPLPPPPGVYPR